MKITKLKLFLIAAPFLIWLVFTYPLIFKLDSSIYGGYFGDWVGAISRFFSIQSGTRSLVWSDLFSPYTFLSRFLAYLGAKPVFVHNLSIFFGFLLTFWGGWFLVRTLKLKKFSSAVFALALTIAPIRLWYSFEWANHAQWGFILIYLGFLFRFLQEYKVKPGVLAGIFFGFNLAENYYHGVMLFFFTGILLVVDFFYNQKWKDWEDRLGSWGAFGFSAFICTLPNLYRFITPGLDFSGSQDSIAVRATRDLESVFTFAARPWHYLVPDINHPLFGDFALRVHKFLWSSPPYYLTERFFPKEHTLYLGITLLVLAFFAFFCFVSGREKHAQRRFLILSFSILSVSMFLASLPPFVVFRGLRIYFPSYFIFQVLPQMRAVARFGLLVFICNACLAMFGLEMLLSRIKKKQWRLVVMILVVFLVLFEFVNIPPFHNFSTSAPQAYRWLGKKDGEFAYVEYPDRRQYSDKLYQHVHGKKILNAAYQTPEEVKELLRNIEEPEFSEQFISLGGRYIFFHLPQMKTEKQKVSESWGFPAWGTHADIDFGEDFYSKELDYFLNDPRFKKVQEFGNIVVFEIVENTDNTYLDR